MIKSKEVSIALERTGKLNLKSPLNYKDLFTIAPQHPDGKSFWARLVKEEVISSSNILWCFVLDPPPRLWLGVMITIPWEAFKTSLKKENPYKFNLQSKEDRENLKIFESEVESFLKEKI